MLEWMRTAVTKLSGTGMVEALDRSGYVLGLGTGAVDCGEMAPVKMAELARYGLLVRLVSPAANGKVRPGQQREGERPGR